MGAGRAGSLVVAGLALAGSTFAAVPASVAADRASLSAGCEVRSLALPQWATHGGVMDIELVPGLGVVYYGNAIAVRSDGSEYQQAIVWYGLDGAPVEVGPPGAPDDVAFELTASGLVNGQAQDPETGRYRGWVQKLRTGKITWAEPAPAGMEPEDIYFRRINDRGAAAGSAFLPDGAAALTWKKAHLEPTELPGGDPARAEGWDINNRREVVGSIAVPHVLDPQALMPQPTLWDRRGRPTAMATLGLDGYPRLLNDARQSAGFVGHGDDLVSAHLEAAFWPSPDEVVGLGLLPGGGESQAYGMDEGGWVVGFADVFDPESPGAEPWGAVWHSFLWTGEDPNRVRVLPSVHADAHGLTDWHQWYGRAAHAVHSGLNQVGTSSHADDLPDGTQRTVPTVYVNADTCGVLVETTHVPFWLEEPPSTSSLRAAASSGATLAGVATSPPGYATSEALNRARSSRD